jgi:hypothetical protein
MPILSYAILRLIIWSFKNMFPKQLPSRSSVLKLEAGWILDHLFDERGAPPLPPQVTFDRVRCLPLLSEYRYDLADIVSRFY